MSVSRAYQNEISALYYDHSAIIQKRDDIEFYCGLAKSADGPVLDLGCGSGRILIPAIQCGIDAVGVDPSAFMLKRCRDRLQAFQAKPANLLCSTFLEFSLRQSFSLIMIPYRSFQFLLTVEEQLRCLRNIHRHLAKGGLLAFDLFNPILQRILDEKQAPISNQENEAALPDGRTIRRTLSNAARNPFDQVVEVNDRYEVAEPDGSRSIFVEEYAMRYCFLYEAEHLIARAGFEILDVFSGFDRSPMGALFPGELIFIARKS